MQARLERLLLHHGLNCFTEFLGADLEMVNNLLGSLLHKLLEINLCFLNAFNVGFLVSLEVQNSLLEHLLLWFFKLHDAVLVNVVAELENALRRQKVTTNFIFF